MTQNHKLERLTITLVSMLLSMVSFAQLKVGNNPTTLNSNAILELEHTNKGMLLPRVSLTGTTSFFPLSAHVEGMVVYNTNTISDVSPGYYYNDGMKWVRIATSAATTNTLTNPSNIITSTVNGVSVTAPAVNTVTNTFNSNTRQLTTTVNGVAGTAVVLTDGADSTTAGNGLTLNGKDVRLGGALTAATTVTTSAANTLALAGLQSGAASDSILVVNPTTGVIARRSPTAITTTNTMSSSVNTMTNTTNGVVATAPIVNTVSNTFTPATRALVTTVNGVAGTAVVLTDGADSTTAGNGLTLNGKDVILGGTLIAPTTITANSSNTLKLLGIQNSTASTDSILVLDANGVIKKRSISSVADRDLNVTTQSGNYTASATDDIIIYNGTTGAQVLTLPTTGIPVGKKIYVTNVSNQDWQISPTPINGGIVTCQAAVGTLLIYVGTGWATVNAY